MTLRQLCLGGDKRKSGRSSDASGSHSDFDHFVECSMLVAERLSYVGESLRDLLTMKTSDAVKLGGFTSL